MTTLSGAVAMCLYSTAPVSTGNTFQDLPLLGETTDNTERYGLSVTDRA
jgi:hypothetical protein